MTTLILLAPRLMGLGSVEGKVRAGVHVASVALATLVVLALLAVPAVLDAHQSRADAREPLLGDGSLKVRELKDSWGGETVTRVLVAQAPAASSTPLPPGVDRLPGVGEALLSPDLVRLVRTDREAMGLLSGSKVAGLIGADGLVAPDELVAYIGVEPAAAMRNVTSFGFPAAPVTLDRQLVMPVLVLLALLVWVPALLLVMVTSRYGTRLKQEHLRLLMVVGVRRSRLRVLAAVEAVILTVVGCAAGCGLFAVLGGSVEWLPWIDLSWFSDDVDVSWISAGVLVGMAIVIAGAVAFASGDPGQAGSTRPALGSSNTRAAAAALLLVGCLSVPALAVAARWMTPGESFRALVLLIALVAIGIPLGLPTLVQRLARRRVAVPRGPITTLSARWLEYSPGSSTRVVAGVGAAVLALSLSMPFVNLLSSKPQGALARIEQAGGTTLYVRGLAGEMDLADLATLPDVSRALPVVSLRTDTGRSVSAVVASCADLSFMSGIKVPCPTGPAWLASSQSIGRFGGRGSWAEGPSGRLKLPRDDQRLTVDVHPMVSGWMLLRPEEAGSAGDLRLREGLVFTKGVDRVDQIAAEVIGRVPTAEVDRGYLSWVSQSQRFAGSIRVVTGGLVAGMVIALLAVFVAALSDGRERLRNARVLAVLGTQRWVTRRALVIAAAVPAVLGVPIAVWVGGLAARLMAAWDDRAAVLAVDFVVIWVVALGLLGLVAAISGFIVTRDRAGDSLRRWSV